MQENKITKILEIVERIDYKMGDNEDENAKIAYINKLLSGKGSVSIRINQAAYEEVKNICDVTGISINSYISVASAMRTYEDKEREDIKKNLEKKG